jgi:hypothetical protein
MLCFNDIDSEIDNSDHIDNDDDYLNYNDDNNENDDYGIHIDNDDDDDIPAQFKHSLYATLIIMR